MRVTDASAGFAYCASTSPEAPQFQETIMSCNVGSIDRIIRILAGLGLIAWALTGGPVWAWVGIVPLATGVFKFCPAYTLIGLNTCGVKK